MTNITISKAALADIPAIEAIYADAVDWIESQGYIQWTKEQVSWAGLTGHFGYRLEDFYVAGLDGAAVGGQPGAGLDGPAVGEPSGAGLDGPVGVMVLMDADPLFWPEIEKGRSLYIHKLAVTRRAAKQGVSTAFLDFAKAEVARRGARDLRLDTGADRPGLCRMYENAGFVCVRQNIMFGNYHVAYYVWTPCK